MSEGWLSEFAYWVASLVPRIGVMRVTHRGVKYKGGKTIVELGPGLYGWWPVFSDVESTPVTWLVQRLSRQILQTHDGQTVVVGGIVVYRVVDVVKWLTENWDADSSVSEICLSAIRGVIIEHDMASLQSNARSTVDNRLMKEAQKHLTEYGVEVRSVRLTDLAPARVLSLVHAQDVPKPNLITNMEVPQ